MIFLLSCVSLTEVSCVNGGIWYLSMYVYIYVCMCTTNSKLVCFMEAPV